jgi:hypothetical protein
MEYVNLYKIIRNYIWDFKTVCQIADLELSCYESCPNIGNIKVRLQTLKQSMFNTIQDDDDLREAFEQFEELLEDSNNTYYCPLERVNEVVDYENYEEEYDYE